MAADSTPVDISGDGGKEGSVDISDDMLGDRDFMSMAKAAMAKAGDKPVKVLVENGMSAGQKAVKEKEATRLAVKQAIADQAGLKVNVSAGVAVPESPRAKALTAAERQEAEEEAEEAEKEHEAAAAAERAAEKAAVEQAAVKMAADQRSISSMLKAAALAAKGAVEAEEEKIKAVPLRFSTDKLGAGVSLNNDGALASAGAQVAQLGNVWIPAGRKPLVWTIAIALESIQPDTTIGIVGRNFWPAEWERTLETCTHAVVLRCGDGKVRFKGKGTSFVLKPLTSGAKLNVTLDMQTLEMTVDLLGEGPGDIVASMTIENIPSEVTVAVGFAKGAPQHVRIVGCTCEKPGMFLSGKLNKDLWDEDNVIEPLALDCQSGRGQLEQRQEEAKVAMSLGD